MVKLLKFLDCKGRSLLRKIQIEFIPPTKTASQLNQDLLNPIPAPKMACGNKTSIKHRFYIVDDWKGEALTQESAYEIIIPCIALFNNMLLII